MNICIGDSFCIPQFETTYVVVGFRKNGKVVANNPHWGIDHDYDFGTELMPEMIEKGLRIGLYSNYKSKEEVAA